MTDSSSPDLVRRLKENTDYMADNPPAMIETDSDLWRETIRLQRAAASALAAQEALLAALRAADARAEQAEAALASQEEADTLRLVKQAEAIDAKVRQRVAAELSAMRERAEKAEASLSAKEEALKVLNVKLTITCGDLIAADFERTNLNAQLRSQDEAIATLRAEVDRCSRALRNWEHPQTVANHLEAALGQPDSAREALPGPFAAPPDDWRALSDALDAVAARETRTPDRRVREAIQRAKSILSRAEIEQVADDLAREARTVWRCRGCAGVWEKRPNWDYSYDHKHDYYEEPAREARTSDTVKIPRLLYDAYKQDSELLDRLQDDYPTIRQGAAALSEARTAGQDGEMEAAFKAGYHCSWTGHGYVFDAPYRPGDPDGAYAAWRASASPPYIVQGYAGTPTEAVPQAQAGEPRRALTMLVGAVADIIQNPPRDGDITAAVGLIGAYNRARMVLEGSEHASASPAPVRDAQDKGGK